MGDTLWQRDEYFQVEPFNPNDQHGLLSVDSISYSENYSKRRIPKIPGWFEVRGDTWITSKNDPRIELVRQNINLWGANRTLAWAPKRAGGDLMVLGADDVKEARELFLAYNFLLIAVDMPLPHRSKLLSFAASGAVIKDDPEFMRKIRAVTSKDNGPLFVVPDDVVAKMNLAARDAARAVLAQWRDELVVSMTAKSDIPADAIRHFLPDEEVEVAGFTVKLKE